MLSLLQRFFFLCLPVVLALSSAVHAEPGSLKLDEHWQLQSAAVLNEEGERLSSTASIGAKWLQATVPTTVLAALAQANAVPDPYFDLNLKQIPGYRDAPWLVMPQDSPFRDAWWFRREFELPDAWQGKVVRLHLEGINYKANVWLNGKQIGNSDDLIGMFRRFQLPVTDALVEGTNVLAIEIIPPGLLPDIPYRTKQVEATTGWDDHNPQPPDLNMGIWRTVYLKATGALRLEHPYAVSHLSEDLQQADLSFSAFVTNEAKDPLTCLLEADCESITVAQEIQLAPGETREVIFGVDQFPELRIQNPRLWWPHPLGKQERYLLSMSVQVKDATDVSDRAATHFGIRSATTYINEEDWRGYKINGGNILIRGGAWMTADMLLRLDKRRYDALVRYAREAHLNMLRSEGFSVRETEEFYDLCDQYGVMVTQQLFGRSIPDEALAIATIEDTLLRIRNHPSLVHFLGHDETFPTETLNAAYLDLLKKHRITQTYQPHSGAFDVAERKETGGTRTGTRELWTYASPAHYYHRKDDGAWGFAQSGGIGGILAAPDSLKEMMKPENLWPALGTEAWSFHTVTQGAEYFTEFQQAMAAGYGPPVDLRDFSRKAYAMNYNSARGMYEAYARNKYDALGITTWKYNAAWPAALTWQYIDWYLRPTAAYYGAKKACEPLHIQYAYDDHAVYILNSLREPFADLQAVATILDARGKVYQKQEATVAVDADGVAKAFVLEIPEELPATWFMKLTLHKGDRLISDNFYWLSTRPDLPGTTRYTAERVFLAEPESRADFTLLEALPAVTPPEATLSGQIEGDEYVAAVTLKNTAATIAFQACLVLTAGEEGPEVAPSFWSDNYISLMPGEEKELTVRCYTRDLKGATPALRVSGWTW